MCVENKVKGLGECVRKQESGDSGRHENTGATDMSRNFGQGLKLPWNVKGEFGL